MIRMVQTASNPAAMLQAMADKNPQMKQVIDLVNQCGGDPQKAFYALAEQKGVDPEEILKALK